MLTSARADFPDRRARPPRIRTTSTARRAADRSSALRTGARAGASTRCPRAFQTSTRSTAA